MCKKRDKNSQSLVAIILSGIAAILIVAGFLVPPMAVIDGSVITGAGELIAISAIFEFSAAWRSGRNATFRHGDTEVQVSDRQENEL